MASMSYCCIENTAGEMWQVLEKFENKQDDIQSSRYELMHLEPLYKCCKQFVDDYEEYLEDKETYIAEHSNDDEEDW